MMSDREQRLHWFLLHFADGLLILLVVGLIVYLVETVT